MSEGDSAPRAPRRPAGRELAASSGAGRSRRPRLCRLSPWAGDMRAATQRSAQACSQRPMRLLGFAVISAALLACQRTVEVSGLYVSDHGLGNFLSCDQPKAVVLVSDSTLATKYRLTATAPYQQVFVRLRGVPVDSGSIYGSAHYFVVQQVVEIRPRRSGECPTRAAPLPSTLPLPRPQPTPPKPRSRPGGQPLRASANGVAWFLIAAK
jgi:hypothetical protein